MANEILMTAEGYKALKDELEDLKTIKRGEVSEKIRVAGALAIFRRTASMMRPKMNRPLWRPASRPWKNS